MNHTLIESHRLLEQHLPEAGQKDHREFAWHYFWGLHQQIKNQPKLSHGCGVRDILFSSDGQALFSRCGDGFIRIWNVASRSLVHELEHKGITSMTLSPDGQNLVSCGWGNRMLLWRVSDGKCLETLFEQSPYPFLSVQFSADGKSLVCGAWKGTLRILDLGTREWIEFPAEDEEVVMSAKLSPDGQKLVSFSEHSVLRIWDVETRKVDHTRMLTGGGAEKPIVFADEGRSIVVCGSKQLNILDISNGETQRTIDSPLADPNSLAISPNGKILAAPCDDNRVRLWNFTTGELLYSFVGHADQTAGVEFSPDGKLLATGARNGVIRFWDEFSEPSHTRFATSPSRTRQTVVAVRDDRTLATGLGQFTGNSPGDMKVWDLDKHQPKKAKWNGGEFASVIALAFSPVGPVIASGGGHRHESGEVKLWDTETGALLKTLPGHKDIVTVVAFSPDGQLLATGCEDRMVRVWDVATSQLQHEIKPISRGRGGRTYETVALEFSPDGAYLVGGGGRWGWNQGEVRLWDVKSGKESEIFTVEGGFVTDLTFFADGKKLAIATERGVITLRDISRKSHESFTSGFSAPSIAVSPDGKTLAAGSNQKSVLLWHTETLGQLGVLSVPHSTNSLTFTPDGQTLIAGCGNATAWLWTLPSEETEVSKVVVLNAETGTTIDDY